MPQMSPMSWIFISLSPIMLMALNCTKSTASSKMLKDKNKNLYTQKKWTW